MAEDLVRELRCVQPHHLVARQRVLKKDELINVGKAGNLVELMAWRTDGQSILAFCLAIGRWPRRVGCWAQQTLKVGLKAL